MCAMLLMQFDAQMGLIRKGTAMIQRRIIATVATAVSLALASSAIVPSAFASSSPAVEDVIADAYEDVGIDTGLVLQMNDSLSEDSLVARNGEVAVVPRGEDGIVVQGGSTSTSLEIPDASSGDLREEDGFAVSSSVKNDAVDYSVVPFSDGSIKVHSILKDKSAPERFEYKFSGVDAILVDDETGVAFLFAIQGDEFELVGGVDRPWAVDASGVAVPTHFEAYGNVLTQVVEHRAGDYAYPITADPSWWDNVKSWFKNVGSFVAGKAKSAASWLGKNAKWLAGKSWIGIKNYGPKVGKFAIKKIGPWGWALCAVPAGWAWYRSDASGWVRVGDAVAGCFG